MSSERQYTFADRILQRLDVALRTLGQGVVNAQRPSPAQNVSDGDLSAADKKHSAALMRVNHSGEVCAQALYQGQAMTARRKELKTAMQQAAQEENDHLAWCSRRITELGSHTSYLNPVWYIGSLAIGVTAGLIGDRWNLGFLAETENQVVRHLQGHLGQISAEDHKSRAIIDQMIVDENKHATTAVHAGASELPAPVRHLMGLTSQVMTRVTYYL